MATKDEEPPAALDQKGSVPVPDPTKLTTDAVKALKEQMTEWINIRFENITKELDRIRVIADSRPAAVIQELNHLNELMVEKFKGVDQQFAGRDTALAAALLAQKTSVDEQNRSNALSASKSEAATTKQIDGIAVLIAQQNKSIDDKTNDLKDRITTIESKTVGASSAVNWGVVGIGVVLTLISIAAAVVGLVTALKG